MSGVIVLSWSGDSVNWLTYLSRDKSIAGSTPAAENV